MTREQLDRANALSKRIERLQYVLNTFRVEAANMDKSLPRMTSFNIICDRSGSNFHENINQGELLFLIEAYENEITRLEEELANV